MIEEWLIENMLVIGIVITINSIAIWIYKLAVIKLQSGLSELD